MGWGEMHCDTVSPPPHVRLQGRATPLHEAAASGHVVVALLLLDRGAAVDAKGFVSVTVSDIPEEGLMELRFWSSGA